MFRQEEQGLRLGVTGRNVLPLASSTCPLPDF
jgi:hypothetical protein